MSLPFFAILIPTYRRKLQNVGGLSYHFLYRCLSHIKKQTYPSWKVFLIGDYYEDNDEFLELAKIIPSDKIYYENLPSSPEREKYKGKELWSIAGFSANKRGYELIKQENIPIMCLSNDDDWWLPNHLETLYKGYQTGPQLPSLVYTTSTYMGKILPDNDKSFRAYNVVYSAVSWKIRHIPLFFRNIVEEGSNWVASDADLWERMRDYCSQNNLGILHMPVLTCRHEGEVGSEIMEVPWI